MIQIPLLSSPAFMYSLWFLFCFSQMLFVLRGLVFFKPTVHYKNVLLLKVKFGFILVCLAMSIATVLYGQESEPIFKISPAFRIIVWLAMKRKTTPNFC
jgi:hypothetical protein